MATVLNLVTEVHPFDALAQLVRDSEANVLRAKQNLQDAEAELVEQRYAFNEFVANATYVIPQLRDNRAKAHN